MSQPLSRARAALFVLLGLTPLAAQAPLLRLQPTANPGQPLQSLLLGNPNQPFATLMDTSGGPVQVLGETFWLSLAPAILESGRLDVIGAHARILSTPNSPGLVGMPFFAQSIVLDALAPNGLFRASNGQSAILHSHSAAIVFEFRNAAAEGVTGSYDATITERLMAGPIVRRTQSVSLTNEVYPVMTPLVPSNARSQSVYRAADLGAIGQPEFVTALRWRPVSTPLPDSFARVHITLGHSQVVPDYTVDPFSELPVHPASGLGNNFAANYRPMDVPVVVCDAPYNIIPLAVRPDGFLGWPAITTPFLYDGIDSLLVDYRVVAGASTTGVNALTSRVMVESSPLPNSRVFVPPTGPAPSINPFAVTTAAQGDNAVYDLQLDLVRAHSTATTRFQPNPGAQRRCFAPLVAASLPPGTSYQLAFEAAVDQSGTGGTGFVADPTLLPALPWLRVRVTFVDNPFDGARPSIDTLVIPVD